MLYFLSVNLFAQGNPQVKNLPVALIVNDEGQHVDTILEAVKQMSQGVDGAEPVMAFTNEKEENIESLFADKKYYAALVIPEGYNDTLQNALSNNEAAKLQISINQGFNMSRKLCENCFKRACLWSE